MDSIIAKLKEFLSSEENELVSIAAAALSNFSDDSTNDVAFEMTDDLMKKMISIVADNNSTQIAKKESLNALWTASVKNEKCSFSSFFSYIPITLSYGKIKACKMREMGMVPVLLNLAKADIFFVEAVAGILRNMCDADVESRRQYLQYGGVEEMYLMLFSEVLTDEEKSLICGSLWNACQLAEASTSLVELGFCRVATNMLSSKSVIFLEKLLGLIWNLTTEKENREKLVGEGVFEKIITFLDHPNDKVVRNALGNMRNFCCDTNNCLVALKKGMVDILLDRCLNNYSRAVRERSVAVVWNLSVVQEVREYISEKKMDSVWVLFEFLEHKDPELVMSASRALFLLCFKYEIWEATKKKGLMENLFDALSNKKTIKWLKTVDWGCGRYPEDADEWVQMTLRNVRWTQDLHPIFSDNVKQSVLYLLMMKNRRKSITLFSSVPSAIFQYIIKFFGVNEISKSTKEVEENLDFFK